MPVARTQQQGEQEVWKAQYVPERNLVVGIREQAVEDCRKATQPDVSKPFVDLEDACERLLPFHVSHDEDEDVFLSEEPEEADYDETEGYTNAYLVVPRRQAWKNTCIRKVNEFTKNLDGQAKRLQAMERKMDPALGLSLDERILVEKLLLEDERARLEALKKEIEAEKKAAGEKAPPTGGVAQ